MAAITKSEIIALALTRNLSVEHIKDTDIAIAKKKYVDAYLDGITYESAIYDAYVKPVIAFGVVCNIFHRVAVEITDRGVVSMTSQGAQGIDRESKLDILSELKDTLNELIQLMVIAGGEELTQEFEVVGFTGQLKQEKL